VTVHFRPAAFDKLRLRVNRIGHRPSIQLLLMQRTLVPHPELVEGRRIGLQKLLVAGVLLLLPLAAHANTIAELQGLDKTTARVSHIDAPVDQSVRFGTLVITARACVKKPPEEEPNTAAFLVIDEVRPGDANGVESKRVFSGWMFASSPAISALEDPIYDINVLDCKTDATPAPSSGATGK
jgi:hypothetical protein